MLTKSYFFVLSRPFSTLNVFYNSFGFGHPWCILAICKMLRNLQYMLKAKRASHVRELRHLWVILQIQLQVSKSAFGGCRSVLFTDATRVSDGLLIADTKLFPLIVRVDPRTLPAQVFGGNIDKSRIIQVRKHM